MNASSTDHTHGALGKDEQGYTSQRIQAEIEVSMIRNQGLAAGDMALEAGDTSLKLRAMALQDRCLMTEIRDTAVNLRREALDRNDPVVDNPVVEHKLGELESACLELEARSREWDITRVMWQDIRAECEQRVAEMVKAIDSSSF